MNCDNCGVCCTHIVFTTGKKILEDDYCKARGLKQIGLCLEIPCVCPNFDKDTKKCKIYEDRPKLCKDFPVGGVGCLLSRKLAGL